MVHTCADLANGLARTPLDNGVRIVCSSAADAHQRLQRIVLHQHLDAPLGNLRY